MIRNAHEIYDRRRGRNLAVLLGLLALVALLFTVTMVKLGPQGAHNPTGEASWGQALVTWLSE